LTALRSGEYSRGFHSEAQNLGEIADAKASGGLGGVRDVGGWFIVRARKAAQFGRGASIGSEENSQSGNISLNCVACRIRNSRPMGSHVAFVVSDPQKG